MPRRFLTEHDHDVYLIECLEDAARVKPRVNKNVEAGVDGGPETVSPSRGLQGVIPVVQDITGFIAAPDSASTTEGYDPDLDEKNGWVGAEERERVVRGEQ